MLQIIRGAFFIVAIGTASDFPKMNVVPLSEGKAELAFNASQATMLEITLTNSEGEIVYFKKTKQRYTEYNKTFDFAELGEGKYCMCVNFGNRSINRNVSVQKDEISVSEPQRLYEPYFSLKDRMLSVSFFNCPCEPVYVNVYCKGRHVSGFKLGKSLTVQKFIDLSNLRKGEYEIVLTDRFKDHRYLAQL